MTASSEQTSRSHRRSQVPVRVRPDQPTPMHVASLTGARLQPGFRRALAVALLAMLPTSLAWSDAREQADARIEAAEAARQRAAAVSGEWRDTAAMIAEARRLAAAGRHEEAGRLADSAKRQGERGYDQALRERHADFPAYVFDRSR